MCTVVHSIDVPRWQVRAFSVFITVTYFYYISRSYMVLSDQFHYCWITNIVGYCTKEFTRLIRICLYFVGIYLGVSCQKFIITMYPYCVIIWKKKRTRQNSLRWMQMLRVGPRQEVKLEASPDLCSLFNWSLGPSFEPLCTDPNNHVTICKHVNLFFIYFHINMRIVSSVLQRIIL